MSDRSVTITVAVDSKTAFSMDLTEEEYRQVVLLPMAAVVDDGPWSWDMQERQPERFLDFVGAIDSLNKAVG